MDYFSKGIIDSSNGSTKTTIWAPKTQKIKLYKYKFETKMKPCETALYLDDLSSWK